MTLNDTVTEFTTGRVYPFVQYDSDTDTGAVWGFFSLGKMVMGDCDEQEDCDHLGGARGVLASDLAGGTDGDKSVEYDEAGMVAYPNYPSTYTPDLPSPNWTT